MSIVTKSGLDHHHKAGPVISMLIRSLGKTQVCVCTQTHAQCRGEQQKPNYLQAPCDRNLNSWLHSGFSAVPRSFWGLAAFLLPVTSQASPTCRGDWLWSFRLPGPEPHFPTEAWAHWEAHLWGCLPLILFRAQTRGVKHTIYLLRKTRRLGVYICLLFMGRK